MKRGVIGRIAGDLRRIESFSNVRDEDGVELRETIEVTGIKRTPGGLDITVGEAASDELTETDSISHSNGEISVSAVAETVTNHTEFLAVGGEFAAVANNSGTFAFDLLGAQYGVEIDRVTIDLDAFWVSLDDAIPWKVGFYGHDGPVENGVVHGESVLDDGVFGSAIKDLMKNQLGVRAQIDGQSFKFVLTKSGYLEVYEPQNVESAEFAEFISNKILPHSI